MATIFRAAATAGLAVLLAPAAQATVFPVGGAHFFLTNGSPGSAAITAVFYNGYAKSTAFDDSFTFTIPRNGLGSGSISTSFSNGLKNKLTITGLLINGVSYAVPANGSGQSASVGNITILSGVLNTIEVKGFTKGAGSYAGTATFTATPVPEAATWMMMLGGFSIMGGALRRRSRIAVAYS